MNTRKAYAAGLVAVVALGGLALVDRDTKRAGPGIVAAPAPAEVPWVE